MRNQSASALPCRRGYDARVGRDGKPYGIGFSVASGELEWAIPLPGWRRTHGTVSPPPGARRDRSRSRAASPWRALTRPPGAVFDGSFLQDQQAALNFLYQAVPEVTVVAKQIIAALPTPE
jgi:feruloyl esterase